MARPQGAQAAGKAGRSPRDQGGARLQPVGQVAPAHPFGAQIQPFGLQAGHLLLHGIQ